MDSDCNYNAGVDFVDRHVAEGRGAKTAFIDPSRSLSYGELRDRAARVGPLLARLGVERENRIALVLLDTVDFPVLFWGAVRAGVVPVLLNTRLPVEQYRYLLEDSRAKAVFASPALLPAVEEAAREVASAKSVIAVGGSPGAQPGFEALLATERPGSLRGPAPTRSPTGCTPRARRARRKA